jgi:hypothetical protein
MTAEAGSSMEPRGTKFHLHFKNFHPRTLEVTEAVMEQKPWKMEDFNSKQGLFEKWLKEVSDIYTVPCPELMVYEDEPSLQQMAALYDSEHQRLYMRKHSLVSLFFLFRQHVLVITAVRENKELDAESMMRDSAGWAASLFYMLRPFLFRRSVREGKILLVQPRDLLANPDEYVDEETQIEQEFNQIIEHGFDVPEGDL